jgi:hypothetical protein
MAKYYDEWTSYDEMAMDYGKNAPTADEVIYAGYSYQDYNGSAIIVFARDGKLYENNDGHCSCNGLGDWLPEETSVEALLMRDYWPGLHEAVTAWKAGQ